MWDRSIILDEKPTNATNCPVEVEEAHEFTEQ
jgi:hypothetical protein